MNEVIFPKSSGITIFVKENNAYFDVEDQSMKAVVSSFELDENRALFHLRDVQKLKVQYLRENTLEKASCPNEKIASTISCAVESILKYLHKENCVQQDIVSFQLRHRASPTGNVTLSTIINALVTKEAEENPLKFRISFKDGIVSRTYAYLEEGALYMYFNKENFQPDTLKKIERVLASLFPRTEEENRSPFKKPRIEYDSKQV